jgi:hypothetical protein
MKRFYSVIAFTVLVVMLGFSSVTYTSCERDDSTMGCDTLKCLNWGVCAKGVCTCPSGYDGYNCGVVLAAKFIDTTWAASERVIGSSNASVINTTDDYFIRTRPGHTATSFFVDSINGDVYRSQVLCEITSPTTFQFENGFKPINDPDNYKILGGSGNIDTSGAVFEMEGVYYRYVNDVFGQHTDTLEFTFTKY